VSIKPLQGFRDFYPPELAVRQHVFDAWRDVARRFGFEEYDGPPLEPLELYTRKSGQEIVAQLYHFKDKGDRDVALRPEMTPTLARMMATRAASLPKPIKWFSIPQLFRYERKQRGRLREHFQLNLDIIGAREVEADAELLAAALEVQRVLGLSERDVAARVNDRRIVTGALKALEVREENVGAVYAALDKFHKIPRDTFRELLAGAGVPRGSIPPLEQLSSGETRLIEELLPPTTLPTEPRQALDNLRRYLEILKQEGLGDWVTWDFSIVRGLAYYTGIVFELYDRQGELRALCGGGRYDDLIASLGGPDLPALGFGMGDVVLTELLRDRNLLPPPPRRLEVAVIPVGAELSSRAREVVRQLRLEGVAAETPFRPQGVGKDLRSADQAGARHAVIVGPVEWEKGEVTLKELESGSEERIRPENLAEALRRRKP